MVKNSIKKKISRGGLLFFSIVFFSFFGVSFLYAADLTSTNFIIRDPVLGTGSGFSSSSSFQNLSSGNLNIQGYGSSLNFINQYGFLYYPGAVEPSLTFSLDTNSVSLGTLSPSITGSGSHGVSISTNASGGFALTVQGQTLTNGSATVSPIGSTATSSSQGTEQFGINLRDNTAPNIGSDLVQNTGTCSYETGFGTVDNFKFTAGASNTLATGTSSPDCEYTVSYIANISSITDSGSYATTLDFVVTGTF